MLGRKELNVEIFLVVIYCITRYASMNARLCLFLSHSDFFMMTFSKF